MLLLRAAKGGVFEVLNETANRVIGTMVYGWPDKMWHFNNHFSSGSIFAAPRSEIEKVLLVLNSQGY